MTLEEDQSFVYDSTTSNVNLNEILSNPRIFRLVFLNVKTLKQIPFLPPNLKYLNITNTGITSLPNFPDSL